MASASDEKKARKKSTAKADDKATAAKQQQRAEKRQQQEEQKEAFELVRIRNQFYRDNYRRLIVLLLLMMAAILVLVGIIYYMYVNRPAPKYFATNIQGQIIELQPLDRPSVSDAELYTWAARAVSNAFTINYVEWREQAQSAQDTYFTPSGSEQYLAALEQSGTLNMIQSGKLIATAQPDGAPVINQKGVLQEGSLKGVYAWDLQIPVRMTFQNKDIFRRIGLDVRLLVVRSSMLVDKEAKNLDGAKGIGIARFLAKESKA